VKRPSEGSSEVSDDHERLLARKANQNLACRNYRRRKKEHVKELESKISSQEQELEQLRKEVALLKRGDAFEAIDPSLSGLLEEMRQIVEKLDMAVKCNVDDQSLTILLRLYFHSAEKRHAVANKEIDKLINPLTQAKLATMGYTPSLENPIVSCLSGPAGDAWWVSYSLEAQMTDEQIRRVRDVRDRHCMLDAELREQRLAIDQSIKAFYLQNLRLVPNLRDVQSRFVSGSTGTKLDMADIVQFAQQLNCLRKNWTAQRVLMVDVQTQLNKILTPRQHALLIIRLAACRTFDWPRHVQTLRSAWQLFGETVNN